MDPNKSRQEKFWQNKLENGGHVNIVFKGKCGTHEFLLTGYEEGVIFAEIYKNGTRYNYEIMIYTDSIERVW